ncbi:hypothetical protein heks_5 [Enterococcus phage heks]|nr:hypothetical protein heks_5 [Enterococcus phage heks]
MGVCRMNLGQLLMYVEYGRTLEKRIAQCKELKTKAMDDGEVYEYQYYNQAQKHLQNKLNWLLKNN